QTVAFPSDSVTPGMSTGEPVPPAPSPPAPTSSTPPAGAPATGGHVSQMIRSGEGLGTVPEAPPPLPASLERRSTDLSTGTDPQPARGATAGDGMAVPR